LKIKKNTKQKESIHKDKKLNLEALYMTHYVASLNKIEKLFVMKVGVDAK